MPKIVDHEQRREELAAAVWRLASREGLDAVTIRGVAAEAGWVGRRVAVAREESGEPLEVARALLAIGLPLDDERRDETRLWFAFLGLALTRPPLARAQRLAYRSWRRMVADALRGAQEQGDIDEDVDVEREAAGLVALVDGLAVQASFDPDCLDVGLV